MLQTKMYIDFITIKGVRSIDDFGMFFFKPYHGISYKLHVYCEEQILSV